MLVWAIWRCGAQLEILLLDGSYPLLIEGLDALVDFPLLFVEVCVLEAGSPVAEVGGDNE